MSEPYRANSYLPTGTVVLLFTDIEGSTRLWEQDGDRMSRALATHDAASRAAVEENHGIVVKMTGDGMYAAFGDPPDALNATAMLQQTLEKLAATTTPRSGCVPGCTSALSSARTTTYSAVRLIGPRES